MINHAIGQLKADIVNVYDTIKNSTTVRHLV